MLSPAGPCQCLLWAGLSEQIQGTHRLLFSAKGNAAAVGYTLNTLLVVLNHQLLVISFSSSSCIQCEYSVNS